MTAHQAIATASANIAFVKYWGNLDPALRLPYNDTVSMNLSEATTTTTVAFEDGLADDAIELGARPLQGAGRDRVTAHLDLVRGRAGIDLRARVTSQNTFPMGTGIASSASGYAALTVAAAAAAGLDLDEPALSALARRGSGSAARSVPGGFTWWQAAPDDAGSYAYTLAPADHWDLRDVVAIVSDAHKEVGSGGGHAAATSSPLFQGRLASLPERLALVRRAILERDMAALGPALEAEALSLHAIALTSRPPILYWSPETVALLHATRRWRAEGLEVYFTLDAGPNVHLLCESRHEASLRAELAALPFVQSVLANAPAGPARLIDADAG